MISQEYSFNLTNTSRSKYELLAISLLSIGHPKLPYYVQFNDSLLGLNQLYSQLNNEQVVYALKGLRNHQPYHSAPCSTIHGVSFSTSNESFI